MTSFLFSNNRIIFVIRLPCSTDDLYMILKVMSKSLDELRQLISLLVEAHVSSLPPRSAVINPNAKKVKITEPGSVAPSTRRPARLQPQKTQLTDEEIVDTLSLYGVDSRNALGMLASDRDLRRDLRLGDPKLKNSDYYKRIYSTAVGKA